MLVELTPVQSGALPVAALADHLRLARGFTDDADQSAALEQALRSALAAIEARTGKAIYRRQFAQTVVAWSSTDRHFLPVAPVLSIEAVRITDRVGAETLLDPASFSLDGNQHCPSLIATSLSLPTLGSGRVAEVEFTAGFSTAWEDLPADLRQAVLMLGGAFYGQNEDLTAGLPSAVIALIEPYRTLRLGGVGT